MTSSIGPNPIRNDPVRQNVGIDRLSFQKRTCTTFIPKEIDSERCVCNYSHPVSEVPRLNETWNWKKHTKPEGTECPGTLFPSNRPYLRCDIKTELEQLCYVLLYEWRIPMPKLVMQMIGDVDSTPNITIQKELLQGISDAATASNAWIITNGYREESISELIGEVVYNDRVRNSGINFHAIAVGKWGNIQDCRELEDRNSNNQSTVRQDDRQYKLELNHTHYIFFDDGTCNSLDTGEFTSDLARKISLGARRRIPLIAILVGGTPHALPSIYTNLKKQIPIVIVNESGPFANILCEYLKLTEIFYNSSKNGIQKTTDEDDAYIAMIDEIISHDVEISSAWTKSTLRDALRPLGTNHLKFIKDVRKLCHIIRQQKYDAQGKRLRVDEPLSLVEEKDFRKYLHEFASCLQDPCREYIHIFNINSSKSLKETIYDAFVQARKNLSSTKKTCHRSLDEEVHLALHWSIQDTTESHPVSTARIRNDPDKIKQNRSSLIDALSKNLLLFVINFVKLDIDFAVLFGPTRGSSARVDTGWSSNHHYLYELYSKEKRKNSDPLNLLDKISGNLDFMEEKHLVIVLNKLVGDIMRPFYKDQPMPGSTLTKPEGDADTEEIDAEYIYRDLFIWCVLTYRLDMAKIFLSQMKTRICSALIASKILKSLAAYAPDQAAKVILHTKASDFQTYAIKFVRCSYYYDKHQACELIMRRVELYSGVTCLQMAIAADDKEFLHEDACQALLTNIWYDRVDPVMERSHLIINILTMGIFQLFISIYRKCSSKCCKKTQKTQAIATEPLSRRLEKHGINYTDDYDENGTILQNFSHFHNRPIVKYCYTCFGYALFLFFFSYFMLCAFNPPSKMTPSIHWTEIVTIITVTTMLFEELRQFLSQDNLTLMGKISAYFDLKNRVSNLCLILPSYLLFYIGLVLRFTQTDAESFASARIVMALDLELWFIRSILFIGIAPNLGPKLVMIREMTSDLLLFIIIIIIFIFGYGITSRAMIAYKSIGFSGGNFFRQVIYPVYYFVLGSFDTERGRLDEPENASFSLATHVMLALHMLFVNILLLNLLIALFNFKITDIQTQAHYVWAYDRCDIVRNYHTRPALFPPFTFLISMIQWCRQVSCKNRCANKKTSDEQSKWFKMIPINDAIDRAWSEFERYSTNDYIRQLLGAQVAVLTKGITTNITSESSPINADELRRSLISDLRGDLKESRIQADKRLDSMASNITILESKLTQLTEPLNWIMKTMSAANTSQLAPPFIEDKSKNASDSSLSSTCQNGSNSYSQRQQNGTERSWSNQQLNTGYPTAEQSQLYQQQPPASDGRTETGHGLNDGHDA